MLTSHQQFNKPRKGVKRDKDKKEMGKIFPPQIL